MPTEAKHPEVEALLAALKAERLEIEAKTVPLRGERDRLLAKIQPVLDRIRQLEEQYLSIERPRLAEIDNQVSGLVRILGARRMSDGAATPSTGV